MTEAEWLTATDPGPMLAFVRGKASDRKLRLFACACCATIAPLVGCDECIRVVQVGERFGDGRADESSIIAARQHARDEWMNYGDSFRSLEAATYFVLIAVDVHPHHVTRMCLAQLEQEILSEGEPDEAAVFGLLSRKQPDMLRCFFGNPFRPVTLDPAWRTSTVLALAESVYADRAFDRLPILADALQDAGCDHPDILAHCRGGGPHARGCWVVDLVLGKS